MNCMKRGLMTRICLLRKLRGEPVQPDEYDRLAGKSTKKLNIILEEERLLKK